MSGTEGPSAAEVLYGSDGHESKATAAQTPREPTPGSLYDPAPVSGPKPTVPQDIGSLRAAEDNGLYSRISGLESIPFEAAFTPAAEGAPDALPPEMVTAVAQEYRHMAADIGATPDEAAQLLASAQGLLKSPPSPEQAAKMQGEAAELVVAKYGDEAGKMLDLAKRMVGRDPRMKQLLEHSGMGNEPRTVMTLIELAVRERSKGRLK